MIRQPEREQLNRLSAKTLDQVFVMRVKEGLSSKPKPSPTWSKMSTFLGWLSPRPSRLDNSQ